MPGMITSKSALVVGAASAIAIGALSMAFVMGPASADNPNANASVSAPAQDGAPFGDGDEHGPGRGHGPMNHSIPGVGTVLLKTDTLKAADGTVTLIRHQDGGVTAVSATSISLKTGSVERTYVINDTTDVRGGTVADIAVGDKVDVEALVDGDTATATEIHAHMAPPAGDQDPQGMRMPRRGPDGRPEASFGVEISSELLVEKADGSVVTLNETHGTVVSVDGTTLTLTDASGTQVSFTVPSTVVPERNRNAAALTDFVVGDEVRVLVQVDGSTSTVVAVHGHDANGMGPDGDGDGHFGHGGPGGHGPSGHGPDGDGDGMPGGAPMPGSNPNNA